MAITMDDSSNATTTAKSQHLADSALQPFIQTDFDAADYLNSTLPSLAISGTSRDTTDRVPLSELSTKTQTLLSQLNAQTSRLSDTLTQSTDEMIRGGSRLAYEVEILRGETAGLSETLYETLKDDRSLFVPEDVKGSIATAETPGSAGSEPDYIRQLRTLSLVRSRLDTVIKVFGEAMGWPIAPSELTSLLVSVSGPNVSAEESRSREEKGKEAAQRLRDEINSLIQTASNEEGLAAASQRVEQLRTLSTVWKGTAEEKVRNRYIDNLSSLVEEEQKKMAKKSQGRKQGYSAAVAANADSRPGEATRGTNDGGYGFINNLKRFKGDIYLE